jgi:pimeloyl-ACP methyl ester carboxylesterase
MDKNQSGGRARSVLYRWARRLMISLFILVIILLFVVLPVGGSYLITNGRFRFPERGPQDPEALGLPVTPVQFPSSDDIDLRGWWSPGENRKPAIIFCHGLNRSRLELLQPAVEAHKRGHGVLLFDFRNHGESARAYTTLGIFESHDVCAASAFLKRTQPGVSQVLWGVSMGASTALLAARYCPGFSAVISDSSFLSFRETIAHHLNLFFRLPPFPIANLIVFVTSLRVGFDPGQGDVEAAVRELSDTPILFIAGSEDRRMPPRLAKRLMAASQNPLNELLIVAGAGHGDAYAKDPDGYMKSAFSFLEKLRQRAPALGGL